MKDELYVESSLRLVQEIALLKLVSLTIHANDNFLAEFYEHLVFRDSSLEPTGLMTVNGTKGDFCALKARKHVFNKVMSTSCGTSNEIATNCIQFIRTFLLLIATS